MDPDPEERPWYVLLFLAFFMSFLQKAGAWLGELIFAPPYECQQEDEDEDAAGKPASGNSVTINVRCPHEHVEYEEDEDEDEEEEEA